MPNAYCLWCQPKKMDGFDNPCPVTCTAKEESCFVENFDKSGGTAKQIRHIRQYFLNIRISEESSFRLFPQSGSIRSIG